jgi:hypothetical protein
LWDKARIVLHRHGARAHSPPNRKTREKQRSAGDKLQSDYERRNENGEHNRVRDFLSNEHVSSILAERRAQLSHHSWQSASRSFRPCSSSVKYWPNGASSGKLLDVDGSIRIESLLRLPAERPLHQTPPDPAPASHPRSPP